MSNTTNLQFPFLLAAQAQKHVTLNESLLRLDALVQMSAASATTTAQPASPSDGQLYILPGGKTGADWGGMANGAVAYYRDGVWEQITPKEGWRAYVHDTDGFTVYNGSAWVGLNAETARALETSRTLSLTGDAAGSASFDGTANAAIAATLANSGVTAGTYTKLTVDAKGRATAGASLASSDVTGALGFTPVNLAGDAITGAVTINGNPPMAGKLGVIGAAAGVSLALSDNTNNSLYVKHTAGPVLMGTDSGGGVALCSNGFNARVVVESGGTVRPGADNAQTLGNASYRWSTVYAATGTINTSDLREKADIQPLQLGLDFINALSPIAFRYAVGGYDIVSEQTGTIEVTDANGDTHLIPECVETLMPKPGTRVHFGFAAQDVKDLLDDSGVGGAAMWTLADKDDPDSRQGLRETHLIAVLVKAVQELTARVEMLEEGAL